MSGICHICDALHDREHHVYDEDGWFAFAAAEVPGWMMLGTKQHVEGMWSMSPAQAAALGPAVRALGQALKQATGAHRCHIVYLGESGLHCHLAFFPREHGEPALLDNKPLLAAARSNRDPERAREIAERVHLLMADSIEPAEVKVA